MKLDEDEIYKQIGTNIKHYRKLKGFSQDCLSYEANVNRAFVGCCERAEKHPTIATVYKIAKTLNVPLYKFFILPSDQEERN